MVYLFCIETSNSVVSAGIEFLPYSKTLRNYETYIFILRLSKLPYYGGASRLIGNHYAPWVSPLVFLLLGFFRQVQTRGSHVVFLLLGFFRQVQTRGLFSKLWARLYYGTYYLVVPKWDPEFCHWVLEGGPSILGNYRLAIMSKSRFQSKCPFHLILQYIAF